MNNPTTIYNNYPNMFIKNISLSSEYDVYNNVYGVAHNVAHDGIYREIIHLSFEVSGEIAKKLNAGKSMNEILVSDYLLSKGISIEDIDEYSLKNDTNAFKVISQDFNYEMESNTIIETHRFHPYDLEVKFVTYMNISERKDDILKLIMDDFIKSSNLDNGIDEFILNRFPETQI